MGSTKRRDAGRPRGAPVIDAVMAATLDELGTHGLAALSVERIAAAAEVNKTSIYRRWPTREALVAGALEYVLVDFESGQEDTGSLRGDLLVLARAIADFLATPAGLALARAAFAESSSAELTALAGRQFARGTAEPVGGLVARALERGEWDRRTPPEVPLSMLVGALLHRTLLEHQPVSASWLDRVVDVLAAGLAVRP
ncbi:MAG: TetR/AcrR family transcriptional regulator [Myxococcaceae bacterium]|nr:TetR/AcrR family transcriptional regulator [Myxococcaceae bacterium]